MVTRQPPRHPRTPEDRDRRRSPEPGYQPPRLERLGPIRALIRGATSKGVDITGGVDLDMPYPG
ncbi:hypothetical protein [Lujinxingia litoralis]|uniref:hypothetical protein n=1 Tax=Lujinxingia litoralis TaxID=2211119 RepID=UPI0011B93A85|nr:hypothetical protein [Lujinxingia litoralis]